MWDVLLLVIPCTILLPFALRAKSRRQQRFAWNLYLITVASWMIWLGDRWDFNGIRADYLGYALAGLGILGFCGVNIWMGGPLDCRNDPPDNHHDD